MTHAHHGTCRSYAALSGASSCPEGPICLLKRLQGKEHPSSGTVLPEQGPPQTTSRPVGCPHDLVHAWAYAGRTTTIRPCGRRGRGLPQTTSRPLDAPMRRRRQSCW